MNVWLQTLLNGLLSGVLTGLAMYGSGTSTRQAVGAGAAAAAANLIGLFQSNPLTKSSPAQK